VPGDDGKVIIVGPEQVGGGGPEDSGETAALRVAAEVGPVLCGGGQGEREARDRRERRAPRELFDWVHGHPSKWPAALMVSEGARRFQAILRVAAVGGKKNEIVTNGF
jgi:hypothetical protein